MKSIPFIGILLSIMTGILAVQQLTVMPHAALLEAFGCGVLATLSFWLCIEMRDERRNQSSIQLSEGSSS